MELEEEEEGEIRVYYLISKFISGALTGLFALGNFPSWDFYEFIQTV